MKIKTLNICLFFFFLSLLASCDDTTTLKNSAASAVKYDSKKSSDEKVLVSRFAGSWYPGTEKELKSQLDGFMSGIKNLKSVKNIIALILPHAGYRFSGQTAMYGIASLKGMKYDKVIIMGTSHRAYLKNKISIPSVDAYKTPLGKTYLDKRSIRILRNSQYVTDIGEGHRYEHSVQMEIPLLQYLLKDIKIIPIICGQLDDETAGRVAALLLKVVTPSTLVIISSDFTHYGPDYRYVPFRTKIQGNLKKLDMGAFEQINKLSAQGFREYCVKTGDTVCGINPIRVLLRMLPEETAVTLLKYETSGAVTSDFTNSVSYMAIAFSGKWEGKKMKENSAALETTPSGLSNEEKKTLLLMARKTIFYVFKHRTPPLSPKDIGIKTTPAMEKVMGGFVTLHKEGRLRGCIGEILPRNPIYKVVMNRAVSAAFEDYRFPQLGKDELDKIDIEISVLTPPEKVDSWKDIELGKHGIILSKNKHSAVFLPQVAPEQQWDLPTTLEHLSVKAGLPQDAWKHGAEFSVFEADVFGEK